MNAIESSLIERARTICSRPSVSFREELVLEALRNWAEDAGIPTHLDRWGNLHAGPVSGRTGRRARGRPLVLTAHMDHPGFVVTRTLGRKAICRWMGGVAPSYFRGARVRVERWRKGKAGERVTGRIESTTMNSRNRVERMTVAFDEPVQRGEIGSWDVVSFRRRGKMLWTRAADDLMGCATITAALDRIRRLRTAAPVCAVFTRAEEVGLVGATALARAGGLPRDALIVVLETSKELPRARQGHGPVLRVGDVRSVFDGGVSHFLHETAKKLSARDGRFRYQRCLMDGGTCEASSFGLFGYRVGALALPLVNYHNMGKTEVAAERIHLDDVSGMVDLLTEAAREASRLPRRGDLPAGEVSGLVRGLTRYRRDIERPFPPRRGARR